MKEAHEYTLSPSGGPAVIIARHPCVVGYRHRLQGLGLKLAVNDKCKGCRHCVDAFQCPALVWDASDERVRIDAALCVGCGVCLDVCPKGAIYEVSQGGEGP
jgi:indolepyruvate ferredoxin oxidoreductase alpha subunit